jgi:putative transposase
VQAKVLKLSRSGLYHRPRPVSPADLAIMRRIDELHLDYPFAGSRMLRDLLRGEGIEIGQPAVLHPAWRLRISITTGADRDPAAFPISASRSTE